MLGAAEVVGAAVGDCFEGELNRLVWSSQCNTSDTKQYLTAVGDPDGAEVGLFVGSEVGCSLGVALGIELGSLLGMEEG